MTSKLVSGMVVEGTDKTSELAQRLVDESFNRGEHCGIIIANASTHNLTQPRRYLDTGTVGNLPINIPSGWSGLITASKTLGSPYGTSGVLTYDIEDLPSYRLQILWIVPFYANIEDVKVNVTVGKSYANDDLYDSMKNNHDGELIRAKNTAHTYRMEQNFYADVYMGAVGRYPLTVIFRNEN